MGWLLRAARRVHVFLALSGPSARALAVAHSLSLGSLLARHGSPHARTRVKLKAARASQANYLLILSTVEQYIWDNRVRCRLVWWSLVEIVHGCDIRNATLIMRRCHSSCAAGRALGLLHMVAALEAVQTQWEEPQVAARFKDHLDAAPTPTKQATTPALSKRLLAAR